MQIILPNLEIGRTYTREEVNAYIAPQLGRDGSISDDYLIARITFPLDPNGLDGELLDLVMYDSKRAVVMEYEVWPMSHFSAWLEKRKLEKRPNDRARIESIKAVLIAGGCAFPVWLQKHLLHLSPHVREGHHRLMAFSELEVQQVPVFLLKYAN